MNKLFRRGGGELIFPENFVPAMTSNTTPEGVCFCLLPSTYDSAYKMFYPNSGRLGSSSYKSFIGYMSTEPKALYKVVFTTSTQGTAGLNCPKTIEVQSSDNGTDYATVSTISVPNASTAENEFIINEKSKHKYHRLNITECWGASGYQAISLYYIKFIGY